METSLKEPCSTEDILEMAKFRAEGVQNLLDSAKEFLSVVIQLGFDQPELGLTDNMHDLGVKIQQISSKIQEYKEIAVEIQKNDEEILENSKKIQVIELELKQVLASLSRNDEAFKSQLKKLSFEQNNLTCKLFDYKEDCDQASAESEEVSKEMKIIQKLQADKKRKIQDLKQILKKEELSEQKEQLELETLRKKLKVHETFWSQNESISFASFKKTEEIAAKTQSPKENLIEINYNKTFFLTVVLMLVLALLITN